MPLHPRRRQPRRRPSRPAIGAANARCSIAWPGCASSRSWAVCGPPPGRRASIGRRRAPSGSRGRRHCCRPTSRWTGDGDDNPFTPRCAGAPTSRRSRRSSGVQDRSAQVGRGPGQARRQGRPARARPGDRRVSAAAARHPVAALARSAPRPRSTRRRWSRTRACSRPVLDDFGVKGEIVEGAAGPGRDALRARAGARHQVEPRHRPGRRHRPLDERGVGARRRRAGPQRHRHRAAQCAGARRCSCASCCRPGTTRTAGSTCRWRSARTSAASR